tara:strand:+ start:66 stop:734 length:669 start_codon:yes stop_codon:yes gene_type:complete
MSLDPKLKLIGRVNDGRVEIEAPRGLRLSEGALVELRVTETAIPTRIRPILLARGRHYIVAEGATVYVAVSVRTALPRALMSALVDIPEARRGISTVGLASTSRLVPVTLGGSVQPIKAPRLADGSLVMVARGSDVLETQTGQIELPNCFQDRHAISLNHAITRLSNSFEPWRKANTGSIYKRIWLQLGPTWISLGAVRDQLSAGLERSIEMALSADRSGLS